MPKKELFQKLYLAELRSRLASVSLGELLLILKNVVLPAGKLREHKDNYALVAYAQKTWAFIYLDIYGEEALSLSELLSAIRQCQRSKLKLIKVFVPGELAFSPKELTFLPAEIDLDLYFGERFWSLLAATSLAPKVTMLRARVASTPKRLQVIKQQILKKRRQRGYLIYGVCLLVMASLQLGNFYLNVVSGLFLLFLAFLVGIQKGETAVK